MTSNFAFLKEHFPVLANFGRLAESYCYSDANSCLMKLGMIGTNDENDECAVELLKKVL